MACSEHACGVSSLLPNDMLPVSLLRRLACRAEDSTNAGPGPSCDSHCRYRVNDFAFGFRPFLNRRSQCLICPAVTFIPWARLVIFKDVGQ
jgi:hypothetical protein